jgi:hypothetical protein
MIYRALHATTINLYPGEAVPVGPGELVDFIHDPGEGWEVNQIDSISDSRQIRRDVRKHRSGRDDNQDGL